MDVTLLCFDDCPNADLARLRLAEALERVGADTSQLTYATVDSPEEAERLRFRGSPTVLVNGSDPFADDDSPVGLSCRIYRTATGSEGAPSVDALVAALRPV